MFWRQETQAIEAGIAAMQTRLRDLAPPAYRLVGMELEPLVPAGVTQES